MHHIAELEFQGKSGFEEKCEHQELELRAFVVDAKKKNYVISAKKNA